MNLVIAIDHRFDRTPDGAVWSWFFEHAFWARYLQVFDSIRVLARVRDVESAPAIAKRSDGERVTFSPVPFYHGPLQYLQRAGQVKAAIRAAVGRDDAVVLRSGQIANLLARIMQEDGHPYGMEVIGDPYDVFAKGANTHPLRPLLRWWYPQQLRTLCSGAAAVSYVTEAALQRRYPAKSGAFTTYYSSIELKDEGIAATPKPVAGTAPCKLITVGTMDQPYKGHDILIAAVAACVNQGIDVTHTIVGDGRYRASLEAQVRELGLSDRVRFLGQLGTGAPVRAQLDEADLFVLPSKTEGLPRALIEAMARGLPAIATSVGGVPELLPAEDRVPAGDAGALARKLAEVIGDRARLEAMAARNLAKAREYHCDVLRTRRNDFYRYVQEATHAWAGTVRAGSRS